MALENAEKAVRRHEAMTLGREDARRFFDTLADPPPPNDRLRAALEEHRRLALTDSGAGYRVEDVRAAARSHALSG